MPSFVPVGKVGGLTRSLSSGDTIFRPMDLSSLSNNIQADVDVSLTASQLLSGLLVFSGAGGVTVTLPSVADIYTTLFNGSNAPDIEVDMGCVVDVVNWSGDILTYGIPSDFTFHSVLFPPGVSAGSGNRLLLQWKSVQAPTSIVADVTQGSDLATLKFASSLVNSAPMGASPFALNISTGAWIAPVEDFLATGGYVTELLHGTGGIAAIRMSETAAAAGTIGLNILPYMQISCYETITTTI